MCVKFAEIEKKDSTVFRRFVLGELIRDDLQEHLWKCEACQRFFDSYVEAHPAIQNFLNSVEETKSIFPNTQEPIDESIGKRIWGKIQDNLTALENPLIKAFHGGLGQLVPAAARDRYEPGEECFTYEADIQIPEREAVQFVVSFWWIETPSEKSFWGKIKLLPEETVKRLPFKNQSQFFTSLSINLFKEGDKEPLASDLRCDKLGNFYITNNVKKIRQALDNRELQCSIPPYQFPTSP